jgi:predicted aldo/keto reductase-like oxidoreductase
MPLNVMDAHYASFGAKVLPELVKREIGVLGMKPLGSGEILKSKTVEATECLRYALSLPVSVVITGCDSMKILDQALEVGRNFKGMEQAELAALLQRSAPAAQAGKFELYKTSTFFDGTTQHPEWLG